MLERLIMDRAAPPSPATFAGEFAKSVGSAGQQAYVVIPSASREHSYGPCPWPQRGTDLPLAGDRCLVAFADDGSPWVIGWWPS